jgi:hypothetical protein
MTSSPPSFEDLFSRLEIAQERDDLPYPVIPSLLPYFQEPTFANARALLADLELPVPYAEFVKVAEKDRLYLKSRGGSGARPAATPAAGPVDFFALHRRIDILHDLREIDITREGLARILRGTDVPADVHAALRKITQMPRGKRNVELGKLAESVAAIRAGLTTIAMTPGPASRSRVVYADATFNVRFSEWLNRRELEIVLDGIFKTPIPAAGDGSDAADGPTLAALNRSDGDGARSLALCAFLQLVIGDCPRLKSPDSPPPGVKTIRFLVGDFQTMDVKGASAFIQRWVACLRTESPYLRSLAPAEVVAHPLWIKDLPSLAGAPFPDVAVTRGGLLVGAVGAGAPMRVPYRPPTDASKLNEDILPDTPRQFLAKYSRHFHTSVSKQTLAALFRDYQDTAIIGASPPGSAADRLVDAAITVNAFRDAIKAEVALARGAVYITLDNLALVYYAARAEQLGAGVPRQGMMIRPTGPGELVYKGCVPDIFPAEVYAQLKSFRRQRQGARI